MASSSEFNLRNRSKRARALLVYLGAIFLTLLLCNCESSGRSRPLGVVRLGPWKEFLAMPDGAKEYPAMKLLVRKETSGVSVMSLLCTTDLSTLSKRIVDGQEQWYSDLSGVAYDSSGRVISGPSKHSLPYYQLFVGQGPPGQPLTLYAYVGREKASDWRLPLRDLEAQP